MRTIQAEDEIAAASMALGAAFGGALGVTCTSGPGLDLKTETIGLAVMLELPMVIIDVQRAGPSTGMPTKTEQSDLLQALYGRHGESPLPVVASSSPGQCFDAVYEAVRIAVTYRTPVILLSDLFVANSSEPWQIPSAADLPRDRPALPHDAADGRRSCPTRATTTSRGRGRSPARPGWRTGSAGWRSPTGRARSPTTAPNHARMTELRAAKVDGIEVPDLEVHGDEDADLLVLGWGSSYGTIRAGARRVRERGGRVATAHLHHLRPAAGEPRRAAAHVRARARAGDEQRAARARAARALPRRRRVATAKVQGQPLLPSEMEHEIWQRLS